MFNMKVSNRYGLSNLHHCGHSMKKWLLSNVFLVFPSSLEHQNRFCRWLKQITKLHIIACAIKPYTGLLFSACVFLFCLGFPCGYEAQLFAEIAVQIRISGFPFKHAFPRKPPESNAIWYFLLVITAAFARTFVHVWMLLSFQDNVFPWAPKMVWAVPCISQVISIASSGVYFFGNSEFLVGVLPIFCPGCGQLSWLLLAMCSTLYSLATLALLSKLTSSKTVGNNTSYHFVKGRRSHTSTEDARVRKWFLRQCSQVMAAAFRNFVFGMRSVKLCQARSIRVERSFFLLTAPQSQCSTSLEEWLHIFPRIPQSATSTLLTYID